jgi:AcrR family transcriptional regulator
MPERPKKRGPEPSAEKREAIVAAALRLFAAKGVDAATTREIAAAAGTTERTLFKHFASKDGVVQAAVEAASAEFARSGAFARINRPEPFTRAEFAAWHRAFLAERVAAAARAPDSYRMLLRELLRDDGFRRRYGAAWLERVFRPLASHLERMRAAGEIGAASSPAALASAFFGLNLGYLFARSALAPEMPWEDERDVEAVVALFQASCGQADVLPRPPADGAEGGRHPS